MHRLRELWIFFFTFWKESGYLFLLLLCPFMRLLMPLQVPHWKSCSQFTFLRCAALENHNQFILVTQFGGCAVHKPYQMRTNPLIWVHQRWTSWFSISRVQALPENQRTSCPTLHFSFSINRLSTWVRMHLHFRMRDTMTPEDGECPNSGCDCSAWLFKQSWRETWPTPIPLKSNHIWNDMFDQRRFTAK